MAQPVYAPQMLRKDMAGTLIEALMAPKAPGLTEQIATVYQSTSDKENLAWLGEVAPMEEFVDELVQQQLLDTGTEIETGSDDRGYEVKNKTYAGSLAFKRDDLADEKVGGMRQRIRDLATRAYYLKDKLLVEKLVAGTSDTCYIKVGATAEAFFSATHAVRGKQSATWSNYHTGTGTSTAQCQTDIAAAIGGTTAGVKGLFTYEDEGGEPLNMYSRQLFVLYPPAINKPILEAIKAGVISQTSNVQFSELQIIPIMEPRLQATSAVDYYVGILDAEIRGMMWQDREGITMEQVGPGSDTWTVLRQVIEAVFLRGRACYGRPQRLVMVNNT